MSKTAKHEILYIIRPDLGDDQKKELVERFDAILTDNGAEITKSEYWDTNRKFAYEIEGYTEGDYYVVNLDSTSTDAINEFDRLARINDNILRHMIVRLDHLED
ncbi:MAG TPA: 30S ribosomal protein S6 [Candidatus Atopostipes pullistercoris]|uniref:Small ribosomal subunit protein bS6 n=1 Tax=Candidatus Atopostipes pullistercoris TaxID=2838467 RepID=A0A9D2JYI9_9LACT|nr:30S ribosomal protein S6 [Candidatus Atopostipes pullistercoris]